MTEDPLQVHDPRALTMVRVSGQDYPLVRQRNCKVCMSPYRLFIENELAMAKTYQAIIRQLEAADPDGDHPGWQTIRNHWLRSHVVEPARLKRQIMEDRANQMGMQIIEGESPIYDRQSLVEMLIHRGWEKVLNQEIDISMDHFLKLLDMQQKMATSDQDQIDQQVQQQAMIRMVQIMDKYIPAEVKQSYFRELKTDPILNAITTKAYSEETDVVSSEALD